MPVIKLKYANKENTSLQVTTDSGEYSAPWPCFTWHSAEIQAAIDAGLSIEPWKTDAELAQEAKQVRIGEINARLLEIDTLSIRPLRAIQSGTATSFDTNKLATLDTEAAALRTEKKSLTA